jgi:hypothetical protein
VVLQEGWEVHQEAWEVLQEAWVVLQEAWEVLQEAWEVLSLVTLEVCSSLEQGGKGSTLTTCPTPSK